MLIPILVFLACVSAGTLTSARRLPDLGEGAVGGLAFLVVCCLVGAALGIVGLRIYGIVHALGDSSGSFRGGSGSFRAEIVAQGLVNMLWETGSVLGIAAAVYLLAPSGEPPGHPASDIDA